MGSSGQRRVHGDRSLLMKLYFVFLVKSHLQSYPCPLQINFFWNFGFLLGIAILLQIVTGIFLALHYTSDLNSAYFSLFFLIPTSFIFNSHFFFVVLQFFIFFIFIFYLLIIL